MGQYWKLFSLDRCEQYTGSCHELSELLFDSDRGADLEILLKWPADSVYMIGWVESNVLPGLKPAGTEQANPESHGSSKSLTLGRLPNEIIHTALDFNDDIEDVVSFSLTCRHFWEIGKCHIMRIRDSLIHEKTWAGTQVICAGDCQGNDDWPSSISEEKYRLYSLKNDWPDCSETYRILPGYELNGLQPVENRVFKYLCKDYYEGDKFVLRNLSKKMYVVEKHFKKLFDGCDQTRYNKINLGHVALAQICWSSDASTSMDYNGPIHRGGWAGDRLEIVPQCQHTEELEEAAKANHELEGLTERNATEQGSSTLDHLTNSEFGWKDVTEECMRLIEDIWKAEYGEDWRESAFIQHIRPGPVRGPQYYFKRVAFREASFRDFHAKDS